MPKLGSLLVKSAPPGKHWDADGPRLINRIDGGRQWVFRDTIHDRQREMARLRDERSLCYAESVSVPARSTTFAMAPAAATKMPIPQMM